MELRPTGWSARRCPGLQTQVREDLFDHRLLKDRGDDLQIAAAIGFANSRSLVPKRGAQVDPSQRQVLAIAHPCLAGEPHLEGATQLLTEWATSRLSRLAASRRVKIIAATLEAP